MPIDLKVTRKKWELHRYWGNPKKIYPQIGPIDAKTDKLHVGSENNAIATACVPQLVNVAKAADAALKMVEVLCGPQESQLEETLDALKARVKELRRESGQRAG